MDTSPPPKPRAHTVSVAGEKLSWKRAGRTGGFARTPTHLRGWTLFLCPAGKGARAWLEHTYSDPIQAPPEGTPRGWRAFVLVPSTPEERARGAGALKAFQSTTVVPSAGGDEGVIAAMALAEKILAKRMADPGRVSTAPYAARFSPGRHTMLTQTLPTPQDLLAALRADMDRAVLRGTVRPQHPPMLYVDAHATEDGVALDVDASEGIRWDFRADLEERVERWAEHVAWAKGLELVPELDRGRVATGETIGDRRVRRVWLRLPRRVSR